ncbi:MAG: UDP-N-acetylmuramate dehydrogenase [Anditalea sp.]
MNIQKNISLKEYNTFGIDKKAELFIQVSSAQEVVHALNEARNLDLPVFVLGGGSNILLTQNIEALVIQINIKGYKLLKEDQNHVWVQVGAGEVWHDFVLKAIASNWAGVENLSLIPGTVGASPMQNIGAYGVEIKEVFDSLEAINIQTLEKEIFDYSQCEFGYRESVFKHKAKGQYIITQVVFRLNKKPSFNIGYGAIKDTLREMGITTLSLEAISKAIIHIRQSKLPNPKVVGNAGSFFKNPTLPKTGYQELQKVYPDIPGYVNENGIKVPAAWFLEQAGWKGKTFGKVGVHKNHPLVLVNYGNGEGSAIKELSIQIQKDIEEKFGIFLQPEVNLI